MGERTHPKSGENSIHVKTMEIQEKNEISRKNIFYNGIRIIVKVLTTLTVEPVLFMFFVGLLMSSVISQSLIIRKYCRIDMGLSDEICRSLAQNTTLETEAQEYASTFMMYKTLMDTFPSVIWGLFVGSWSDKYGRKALLIIPNLGAAAAKVIMAFNAYYDTEWDVSYILLSSVAMGLTGGFATVNIAGMSYIADITTPEQRTLRFGIVGATILCGGPVGLTIGSQIFKHLDYQYEPIFLISGSIYILNIFYILFFIKETVEKKSDKNMFVAFFDLTNVKELYKTLSKKREYHGRLHLILLISAAAITFLPFFAQHNLTYYYTRLRYQWDEVTYSNLTTTELVFGLAGMVFLLPILTKKMKLSDIAIGVIGTIARVASDVLVALSTEGWMIFAASPLLLFASVSNTVVRTMMSKTVSPAEQGKISALLGAAEAFVPSIGSFSFTPMYQATKDTEVPGTIFLVSAALTVIPLCILIFIYKEKQRLENNKSISQKDLATPSCIEITHM